MHATFLHPQTLVLLQCKRWADSLNYSDRVKTKSGDGKKARWCVEPLVKFTCGQISKIECQALVFGGRMIGAAMFKNPGVRQIGDFLDQWQVVTPKAS